MSTTTRLVHATPEQVWRILADGWTYPLWVVGASRMRQVDDHWPEPGAMLHHSVGSWPVLIDDTTSVIEAEPGRSVRLRVRAWPAGEANVTVELRPADGGTEVVMTEKPVRGPATVIPRMLVDPMLHQRNIESLRRLAHIAERRE